MKIEKGKNYYCIKDVVMAGKIGYRVGKVYTSEFEGSLTDEYGNKRHDWIYILHHYISRNMILKQTYALGIL